MRIFCIDKDSDGDGPTPFARPEPVSESELEPLEQVCRPRKVISEEFSIHNMTKIETKCDRVEKSGFKEETGVKNPSEEESRMNDDPGPKTVPPKKKTNFGRKKSGPEASAINKTEKKSNPNFNNVQSLAKESPLPMTRHKPELSKLDTAENQAIESPLPMRRLKPELPKRNNMENPAEELPLPMKRPKPEPPKRKMSQWRNSPVSTKAEAESETNIMKTESDEVKNISKIDSSDMDRRPKEIMDDLVLNKKPKFEPPKHEMGQPRKSAIHEMGKIQCSTKDDHTPIRRPKSEPPLKKMSQRRKSNLEDSAIEEKVETRRKTKNKKVQPNLGEEKHPFKTAGEQSPLKSKDASGPIRKPKPDPLKKMSRLRKSVLMESPIAKKPETRGKTEMKESEMVTEKNSSKDEVDQSPLADMDDHALIKQSKPGPPHKKMGRPRENIVGECASDEKSESQSETEIMNSEPELVEEKNPSKEDIEQSPLVIKDDHAPMKIPKSAPPQKKMSWQRKRNLDDSATETKTKKSEPTTVEVKKEELDQKPLVSEDDDHMPLKRSKSEPPKKKMRRRKITLGGSNIDKKAEPPSKSQEKELKVENLSKEEIFQLLQRPFGIKDGDHFKCRKCDEVFKYSGSVNEHYDYHHLLVTYKCPCCDHSFATRRGLRPHVKDKHPQYDIGLIEDVKGVSAYGQLPEYKLHKGQGKRKLSFEGGSSTKQTKRSSKKSVQAVKSSVQLEVKSKVNAKRQLKFPEDVDPEETEVLKIETGKAEPKAEKAEPDIEEVELEVEKVEPRREQTDPDWEQIEPDSEKNVPETKNDVKPESVSSDVEVFELAGSSSDNEDDVCTLEGSSDSEKEVISLVDSEDSSGDEAEDGSKLCHYCDKEYPDAKTTRTHERKFHLEPIEKDKISSEASEEGPVLDEASISGIEPLEKKEELLIINEKDSKKDSPPESEKNEVNDEQPAQKKASIGQIKAVKSKDATIKNTKAKKLTKAEENKAKKEQAKVEQKKAKAEQNMSKAEEKKAKVEEKLAKAKEKKAKKDAKAEQKMVKEQAKADEKKAKAEQKRAKEQEKKAAKERKKQKRPKKISRKRH